jgi:NitT/TauT family transport system permease protein
MSGAREIEAVAQTDQSPTRRLHVAGLGVLVPVLSGIAGLVAWELAVRAFRLPSYLLPAPSEIAEVMVSKWHLLWVQFKYTASVAAVGFAIALVVSLGLGALIAASRTVERVVYVWLVIFHAIPKVVVAPLLLVWIGFGMKSSIIFVVVFTFFPILVNTVTGLRSADPDLLLLARSMGASRWQVLFKIRLPNALPSIISGVKIAITLAPGAAVIGEFIASNEGLGHMLIQSVGNLEVPTAFAAVTIVSLFGIAVWYLAEWVEKAAIPWHITQRDRGSAN